MLSQEELIARKKSRIQEIHRMDPKRTALLVIDMQCAFLDGPAPLLWSTSSVSRTSVGVRCSVAEPNTYAPIGIKTSGAGGRYPNALCGRM
jgi:hypothetical protein